MSGDFYLPNDSLYLRGDHLLRGEGRSRIYGSRPFLHRTDSDRNRHFRECFLPRLLPDLPRKNGFLQCLRKTWQRPAFSW